MLHQRLVPRGYSTRPAALFTLKGKVEPLLAGSSVPPVLAPEFGTPWSVYEDMTKTTAAMGPRNAYGEERLGHFLGLLGLSSLGASLYPGHPAPDPGKVYLQLFLDS